MLPLTKISLYQILLSVVAGCTFTPRANVCGRKPGQTVQDKFVVVMVTEQACEPRVEFSRFFQIDRDKAASVARN